MADIEEQPVHAGDAQGSESQGSGPVAVPIEVVEGESASASNAHGPASGAGLAGAGAARSAAANGADDAQADEVEEDLDELLRTAAQRDEYLALAQRTQADFENYRKRVTRDSALAAERGAAKLAKELLPALDSLDRALDGAAPQEAQRPSDQRPAGGRPSPSDRGPGGPAEDSHLLEGVRLVREELTAALGRAGIEAFAPLGQTFDPAEHEAVAQAPIEGYASGTVAEVYQTGYRSAGGNVIRPARVLVAA
jgi:molecular chaperone GrpE